ncbi:MAG: cell division protein FtsA [Kiritimatiellae bacterium]|nr:cell division protein FtsA [Kiritimatiellia bacterium]
MANEIIAGVELGTSETKLAMAEVLPAGGVKILSHCKIPSNGMRKSMVVNMQQVTYSLRSVVKSTEKDYMLQPREVGLVVSGPHIKCYPLEETLAVSTSKVSEEDIIAIEEKVSSVPNTQEYEVLDVIVSKYGLDDLNELYDPPKDMHGKLLRCTALVIQAEKTHIKNIVSVAEEANLSVASIFFSGYSASVAVLTQQQKQDGTLVINLGGGTTTYSFWYKGNMLYTNVIGVGGDHVTDDISYAFSISRTQAESIKQEYASAIVLNTAERIQLKGIIGNKNATISLRALHTVVNARMHELFKIICVDLDEKGFLHNLNGGIILTGGGAYLKNIINLAETVCGRSVQLGRLIPEIAGLEKVEQPAKYASVAGLLYQMSLDFQPKKSFLSRVFGGVFKK